ncbi:MAG: cytochrome c peroxidase, partial [Acidobacteriota bacterium]|nr:cytochrome c peroxidase [Acidobacteriota bacterium]
AGLGRMLFFDTRLSAGRNQSCASCHDPSRAFSDPGDGAPGGAVSIGSDAVSLGDRNAPSLVYASQVPAFRRDATGEFLGGLFLDGRASTLLDQAKEPITNPIEMALPDAAGMRERLLEDDVYAGPFERLLGASSLATAEQALQSVATAITAFERGDDFAPFDSKYDRYLRGEVALTEEEETGRALFFSDLVNCSQCHLLDRREAMPQEVFTNHRYHNIGVPPNPAVRRENGLGTGHVDGGLLQNPAVADEAQRGRFRVPSLRNVAVTGPYMHNGVFQKLETAVVFYNRFLLDSEESRVNPETGLPWDEPEVPGSVDLELLGGGQPLTARHVSHLVAFLRTLTDRRYEHLLGD